MLASQCIPWMTIIAGVTVAGLTDIRQQRISNRLTLPLFLGGWLWQLGTGGLMAIDTAFGGMVIMSLPFLVLYAAGCGGAGDVKLMAALGVWLGWSEALTTLYIILIAGGVCGAMYALYNGQVRLAASNIKMMSQAFLLSGTLRGSTIRTRDLMPQKMVPMPYGVPIFAGVCLAAVWRVLM